MAKNCGIKEEGKDLALFVSDVPGSAAALFTRNHVVGAPILVGREIARGGRLQAVVVNSKVSNVATGAEGVERARRMGAAAAAELDIAPGLVLMSSTGVIGRPLPIDRIEEGLRGASRELQDDPVAGAEGIMTTDSYPKAISLPVDDAVLTLVGKGSGMIEPKLATMLVYIFTDAEIEAPALDRMLRSAAHVSFNMLSVDTDTSTSDTCVILANGRAGTVDEERFEAALTLGCIRLTEMLARDGEGATKLLRVRVGGAASEVDARTVARSLINSPLIKTMAYGADPNVGRILMAIGKCVDCSIEPDRLGVTIGGITVVEKGVRCPFDEDRVRASIGGDPVDLEVGLGIGTGSAMGYGCDLTPGYIEENAAYYSS